VRGSALPRSRFQLLPKQARLTFHPPVLPKPPRLIVVDLPVNGRARQPCVTQFGKKTSNFVFRVAGVRRQKIAAATGKCPSLGQKPEILKVRILFRCDPKADSYHLVNPSCAYSLTAGSNRADFGRLDCSLASPSVQCEPGDDLTRYSPSSSISRGRIPAGSDAAIAGACSPCW